MKPEYDVWAENLIQEIYYAPEDQRVSVVKEHLLKAVRRGYVDGALNDWVNAQEAAPQQSLRGSYLDTLANFRPVKTKGSDIPDLEEK